MAKIGIEATKAQIEKAVEVTDGSIMTGENSVALKGTASGDDSVAIRGTASGNYSVSVGDNNEALQDWSTAIGKSCKASGNTSTSVGSTNQSSGDGSITVGSLNTASNTFGIAVGYENEASAYGSIVIGDHSKATAQGATQIGRGINSNPNTLQFRDFQVLDANGKIPNVRLNDLKIGSQTKSIFDWLIYLKGQGVQSITFNGDRLKVTFSDGTYINSDNMNATDERAGTVAMSPYFNMQNGQIFPTLPVDISDPEYRQFSEVLVGLNNIDMLIIECLVNNFAYGDEEEGKTPLTTEQQEAIANLLGLALNNVTIGQTTQTVAQWLTALNNEVDGISEVITDIEGVVG